MITELRPHYKPFEYQTAFEFYKDQHRAHWLADEVPLSSDLNVFCTTKMNSRAVMEQLKQLALNNNTTGASIYDLGNIIKSESIAELTNVLKASEEKSAKIRQEQAQQEQQMQEQQLAAQERQKQAELQAQADRDDKFIQRDLLVAEIRAAGMGAGVDINQNQMSDYQDAMAKIQQQQNYTDSMNLKREQEVNKNRNEAEKLSVERERLAAQKEIADKQLQIARENKNKYDVKEKPTKFLSSSYNQVLHNRRQFGQNFLF